jgi:hypothetical protein
MSAATKQDLTSWFDEGVKQGATHMIVACDTFDYDDYPVYVRPDEDVRKREETIRNSSMQRVMEVYKLDPAQRDAQLSEQRAFHYD